MTATPLPVQPTTFVVAAPRNARPAAGLSAELAAGMSREPAAGPSAPPPAGPHLLRPAQPPAGPPPRPTLSVGLLAAMYPVAEAAHRSAIAEARRLSKAWMTEVRALAAAAEQKLLEEAERDLVDLRREGEEETEWVAYRADRKIAERLEIGDRDLAALQSRTAERIDQLNAAVREYSAEFELALDRFRTESVPAMLERLAEELPRPPDLQSIVDIADLPPGPGD